MSENLEELLASLANEPDIKVNEDAPESGAYAPQVYPGRHRFGFKLMTDQGANGFDKDPYGTEPNKYLRVTFMADVTVPDKSEPVTIKYLRASFQKHPAMQNSDGVELMRCLGIKPVPSNAGEITAALIQADGRAMGEAVFGWEAYSKDTQEIISTNPRKKARKKSGKVDIAWPKGTDGKYQMVVKFPESGDSAYGRETLVSYKLPSGSNGHS